MTSPILKIPTLTTTRLRLEPLSMAHSAGMFKMWQHAAVQKFSGIAEDKDRIEIHMPAKKSDDSDRLIGFWLKAANDGWGFRWAIILNIGGQDNFNEEFVGHIGFNSLADCSEIAYHLNPGCWGKGIMTEAALAAIEWRRRDGIKEIEAFIDPENLPSAKLALRLGMSATTEIREGARRYQMPL